MMTKDEADAVLELASENERFRHRIKELEEMVEGRDQNIAERAVENDLLHREIAFLRRRSVRENYFRRLTAVLRGRAEIRALVPPKRRVGN